MFIIQCFFLIFIFHPYLLIFSQRLKTITTKYLENSQKLSFFHFFLGTVSQLGVGSLLSSSIGDSKISAAMTRAAHNKAQVRIF